MDNFIESADTKHGRLLESVHFTGYSMERACIELEWLLENDKWKTVGTGFENIDEFLETINISKFKIAVDKRKKLAKKLDDLQASQRATAKALGVSHTTIQNDLNNGNNLPNAENISKQDNELINSDGNNLPKAHVSYNSGNNEWNTPENIVNFARDVLGEITVDPASNESANKIVKAHRFYTSDNDGLSQKWNGKIWMNPPYATDLIESFIDKFLEHYKAGDIEEGIILVNNATDTKWFQKMFSHVSAICFHAGRIRFVNGGESGAPLQGQAICYFGINKMKFGKIFGQLGGILYA